MHAEVSCFVTSNWKLFFLKMRRAPYDSGQQVVFFCRNYQKLQKLNYIINKVLTRCISYAFCIC